MLRSVCNAAHSQKRTRATAQRAVKKNLHQNIGLDFDVIAGADLRSQWDRFTVEEDPCTHLCSSRKGRRACSCWALRTHRSPHLETASESVWAQTVWAPVRAPVWAQAVWAPVWAETVWAQAVGVSRTSPCSSCRCSQVCSRWAPRTGTKTPLHCVEGSDPQSLHSPTQPQSLIP